MTSPTAGSKPQPFVGLTPIEASVLQARPIDLARILCGPAATRDLKHPSNPAREWLTRAAIAMDISKPGAIADTRQAAAMVRNGLAASIDGVDVVPHAETVLLQAAWWLLWMQAQLDDLMKVYDVAASKAPTNQPKH